MCIVLSLKYELKVKEEILDSDGGWAAELSISRLVVYVSF